MGVSTKGTKEDLQVSGPEQGWSPGPELHPVLSSGRQFGGGLNQMRIVEGWGWGKEQDQMGSR